MTAKRVHILSLGCPKNRVDAETMLASLPGDQYTLTGSADDADVVVVNTCAFVESAKVESIDAILEMAELKQKGKVEQLVVTGCLAQRYPEDLARVMPEVDHFLGSADMLGLAKVLGGGGKRLGVSELSKRAYLYDHDTPRELTGVRHTAYVKIAEGCDRPCGFCIIP